MIIAYRGTFTPDFTTETHVSKSMELLGHEVRRIEERTTGWAETVDACVGADVFWWTSTRGWAQQHPKHEETAAVDKLNAMLPTVAQHLDLYWGLSRAHWVGEDGWFKLAHVFTADGDHDAEWERAGVNHHFLPPAVYGPECVRGTFHPEYASDVAFIGSWQGYGHPEHWPARKAMLDHLRATYGDRFRCWPKRGQPAVRGQALNDLYASVKVVAGDSCLAATSTTYVSDRLTESAGRGGAVVFPYVEAAAQMLRPEEHVRYFMPGDHAEMCRQVDWLLDHEGERRAMVDRAMAHVRATATYEHRVQTILDTVFA